MKSYTDLEQSNKLAKILPLESADMYYGYGKDKPEFFPISDVDVKCLSQPCWSLAALLGVLPKETKLLKSATDDTYHCDCPKGNVDKWYDNPVDACVEIILNLNKLNLL